MLVRAAEMAGGLGDRDRALAYWRRAAEVAPHDSVPRAALATLLVQVGEWGEAAPALQN